MKLEWQKQVVVKQANEARQSHNHLLKQAVDANQQQYFLNKVTGVGSAWCLFMLLMSACSEKACSVLHPQPHSVLQMAYLQTKQMEQARMQHACQKVHAFEALGSYSMAAKSRSKKGKQCFAC